MNINISLKTFFILTLFLVCIWVVVNLTGIILTFFLAFVVFAGLKPVVDRLEEAGMRRGVAITISYFLIFSVLLFLIYFIASSVATQLQFFVKNINVQVEEVTAVLDQVVPGLGSQLNDFLDNVASIFKDQESLKSISTSEYFSQILGYLGMIGTQSLRVVGGVFGGLFSILLIFFLSVYMVAPRQEFYIPIVRLFVPNVADEIINVVKKIRNGLSAWLAGMLVLMSAIAFGTYIIVMLPALFVQNYPLSQLALLIAIVAGVFEAIPNIGPLISLIFTVILAFMVGTPIVIIVYLIIAFIALQQFEGLFLVPGVMKRAIDIHPIVSILAVLVGFEVTGSPIGALLAIPVVGSIQIMIVELLNISRKGWRVQSNEELAISKTN